MHGLTSVKPSWLLNYASSLSTYSAPLEDREMYYDPKRDQVYCFVLLIFSRHNWQLPLHSVPVNDGSICYIMIQIHCTRKKSQLPTERSGGPVKPKAGPERSGGGTDKGLIGYVDSDYAAHLDRRRSLT